MDLSSPSEALGGIILDGKFHEISFQKLNQILDLSGPSHCKALLKY